MSGNKVAVIFAGLGSQYIGMGKDLYDKYRIIQEYFEEAYNCQNVNFVKLCFASSDSELNQIQNVYQAIFVVNSSIFALLKEMGLKADVFAGEDVGDFSALCASEALSFPDGIYLLGKISGYLADFIDQNQVRVIEVDDIELPKLEKIVDKFSKKKNPIYISYQKSLTKFLVVGFEESMNSLIEYLDKNEIKHLEKKLQYALYSKILTGLSDHVKLYLEKVDIKVPQIPIISPIDGSLLRSIEDLRYDLVEHLVNKFDMHEIISKLKDYDVIIEIGPRSQIVEKLQISYPDKHLLSLSDSVDLEKIQTFFGDKLNSIERVHE